MESQGAAPSSTRAADADQRVLAMPRAFWQRRWSWLRVICAAAVLGVPTIASAQATGALPMLLSSPIAPTASKAASNSWGADRAVTRQRHVAINFQHLDPQSGNVPPEIGVDLFDGQVVGLEVNRIERRSSGNYTWVGRVKGYERSQAILTVVDGQMAGTITYHDVGARKVNTFEIQPGTGGSQTLRQIDPNAFPPDHPFDGKSNRAPPQRVSTLATDKTAQNASLYANADSSVDSGDTIDVMVVYSNQTAAAAGSGIGAQIQQAIDTANTVYANSGIATRLRLVHIEQVAYDESGDFGTDLNRLTTTGDGYMDNVPTLRNTYGADLVSLFVENGQYCGYSWVGPNANYAFSVVNRGCASGNLSFVHELGHNFGALHDPYVDSGNTPYAYGHGLTDPSEGWRDVMAYNNACTAAGTSCTRIPYLSNPNLTYGNPAHPLGTTSTSDVTRVHNQNAYTVANFRVASSGGCTYTVSPSSASISAAAVSGSLSITAAAGCAWNSTTNASWLTIGAGSGTSASGTLNYTVAANSGPARTATITVGGKVFTVNQATGCTFALSPSSASVAAGGASGTVSLTTGAGCVWSLSSSASWLTISSGTSGTGTAAVAYVVAANTGAMRSGNLSANGATFIVTEAAATAPIATAAIAKLSSSSRNFGTISVGKTSSQQSVNLTNSGGGTLTIASMTQTGTNPSDFTRTGACAVNTTLAAGQSCTIQYTFRPSAKGSRAASLAISTNAGTADLSLAGKGR